IGREIATAAARNLVPVTLELGGKCPALLDAVSIDADTVRTVVGTKLIKNGQMCISVDYVLVPRDQLDAFVDLAQAYLTEEVPGYASSGDCTGIITGRHLGRIVDLIQQARSAGARVEVLGGGQVDRATRQVPLHLVADPDPSLRVMTEEVFGPVLPVVPYDSLDDAIAFINAGERPLGLYVFSKDPARSGRVLQRTTSGGACVNVCATQGALPSMGFGGVGQSGTGRHHGIEGFREFSNPRGVFVRGEGDLIDSFLPPYGATAQAIVDSVLAPPAP
ncbi:MAG: aldehyde dehydrogenase family protein, partial [Pseudorhodobacter sp.]|nr:aldehyde dehydrogenase family protein [Frankiaceae bacterium]